MWKIMNWSFRNTKKHNLNPPSHQMGSKWKSGSYRTPNGGPGGKGLTANRPPLAETWFFPIWLKYKEFVQSRCIGSLGTWIASIPPTAQSEIPPLCVEFISVEVQILGILLPNEQNSHFDPNYLRGWWMNFVLRGWSMDNSYWLNYPGQLMVSSEV